MADVTPQGVEAEGWYFKGPFRLVYAGLGLGVSAMALNALLDGGFFTFVRMVLMLAGLLAAGGAGWWRLGTADANDFEEQSKTGILIALASGGVLAAYVALPAQADSLKLAALVLWVIALVAVPIVLLPSLARRAVISLLVLYHFAGIVSATTAVQQPNGSYPWLPTLLWNKLYRDYLTFTYLNNAYHFYSPEPGPPSLVWFQVIFEDDNKQQHTYWKRIVRREDFPTRQQYQRFLSLTESTNQYNVVPPGKFAVLSQRRGMMASPSRPRFKDSGKSLPPIRIPDQVPIQNQYREPSELALRYVQSYAAYVCRTTKDPDHPEWKVKGVRVYRITHDLIAPAQLASGVSPTDPTMYWVYFYGEYEFKPENKDRKPPEPVAVLKGSPYEEDRDVIMWLEQAPNGTLAPNMEPVRDPFLYWLLPIMRLPKNDSVVGSSRPEDYTLFDSLSIHSGDTIKWDK